MRVYLWCATFMLLATFLASSECQESKRTRHSVSVSEQIIPSISISYDLIPTNVTVSDVYVWHSEPTVASDQERLTNSFNILMVSGFIIIIMSSLVVMFISIAIVRRRKQSSQIKMSRVMNGCSRNMANALSELPMDEIELDSKLTISHNPVPTSPHKYGFMNKICQIQASHYNNFEQDNHEHSHSIKDTTFGKGDSNVDSLYAALRVLYVDPVERVTFNSNGGSYYNKQHGIGLCIPPEAISTSESITIEIGVSLGCPILFPTGTKPVSPLLAMCVVENHNYQFLKSVEVKLSHCLDVNCTNDEEDLDIHFVKSTHNLSRFSRAEGEATFSPSEGTLKTKHFCFFCIVANKEKTNLSKVNYRLLKVVPKSRSVTSFRWKVRYCITYFFPTCLRAIEKQYNSEEYNIQSLQRFKFSDSACVVVNFERYVSGGWTLALENTEKIYAKDVDFWDIDSFELKQMELEELYPPRFLIDVCGTEALNTGHVWITFTGMATDFKSELILDKGEVNKPVHSHQSETELSQSIDSKTFTMSATSFRSPSLTPVNLPSPSLTDSSGYSTGLDYSAEPRHQDLMNKVAVKIPDKWMLFGIQLGLDQRQLDLIEQKRPFGRDQHLCFSAVFTEWKERMASPYLWSTIITALESELIGENRLAQDLRKEM